MKFDKTPSEWCEAAEMLVRYHWRKACLDSVPLEEYSSHVIEMWYETGHWDELCQAAMMSLSKRDLMDVVSISHFLAGKQHDYGPRNILKFGTEGLRVRLWDKIARFGNLRKRGTDAKNEPLVDTFMDIIGYVVINDMLAYGWFELPVDVTKLDG